MIGDSDDIPCVLIVVGLSVFGSKLVITTDDAELLMGL